jgi:hypothetical protein
LKTELQTDPTALGYAATGSNDLAKADLLNLPRAGITIRRADVTPKELIEAISIADYVASPSNPSAIQLSTERRYLAWLSGLSSLETVRLFNDDGSNGPVALNLIAMFTAGSGTLTRLTALAQRQGSRAEQLFGVGVRVSASDIGAALSL